MGNNIVAKVIGVFDRSPTEIQSISAKIDRAKNNGIQEKHEVYVENIGLFPKTMVDKMEGNSKNQVFLLKKT